MLFSESIQTQVNKFCLRNKIDFLILFGSFAQERSRSSSDIDLAVHMKNPDITVDKLDFIFQLEEIFKHSLDLVVLTPFTDPLLKFEIFFKGKPLFMKNENYFFEQKALAWKIYVDTKKIRDFKSRYVESYIRKLKNES